VCARVIILWGDAEVNTYYDFQQWTPDTARKMLAAVEVFEFATEDEAEAFRLGLCVVKSPAAKDFTEVPPLSYESLQKLSKFCNRLQKTAECA